MTGTSLATAAALLVAAALSGLASAQGPAICPPCAEPRCVAVPEVKKTTRTVYDCKWVDVCKTGCGCGLFSWLFGGCGDCCGQPREKRALLKFVQPCERPGFKCVVEVPTLPACVHDKVPR